MRSGLKRGLRGAGICLLAWTTVGLFFYTQSLTQKLFNHNPTSWWRYLASWLSGVYMCALATPVIFRLSRRYPIERGKLVAPIALHAISNAVIATAELALQAVIIDACRLFPVSMSTFAETFDRLMRDAFHQNYVSCWIILGVEHALRYYHGYQERQQHALRLELQASELKTQLVRAQLSALNMQLQPHFLFNTLNAVMVLVRQRKSAEAEEMLGRLSDLLRCVLDGSDTQEIPLRQELEYLEQYLAIERVRFQDRLRIEVSAEPAVLDANVPYMGLQPIVENAIRHGIGGRSSAGMIRIRAWLCGGAVRIEVQDDGPGLSPSRRYGEGIGLTNTRERLRQLYGDAASVALENGASGGAVATMSLPYRQARTVSDPDILELHAVHGSDRG